MQVAQQQYLKNPGNVLCPMEIQHLCINLLRHRQFKEAKGGIWVKGQ